MSLQVRHDQIRNLIDHALDAVIGIDDQGIIIDWNRQAEVTFGWSRPEAVGRKMASLIIPPRYRETHERGLKHYLASGEGPILNKRIELEGLRKDGSEFSVELSVTPIKSQGSHVFYAFLRDISARATEQRQLREEITGQKRIEMGLRDEVIDIQRALKDEEIFRTIFNLAAVGMGSVDPNTGRLLHVNTRMEEITGYSLSELRERTFSDITHPEDRQKDLAGLKAMVEGKASTYTTEKRYVRKDGQIVWALLNVAPHPRSVREGGSDGRRGPGYYRKEVRRRTDEGGLDREGYLHRHRQP